MFVANEQENNHNIMIKKSLLVWANEKLLIIKIDSFEYKGNFKSKNLVKGERSSGEML